MICKIYAVYDNGEMIMKASARNIIRRLGITDPSIVAYYSRRGLVYQKRYKFVCLGKGVDTTEINSRKTKEEIMHEKDLEWIRIALSKSPSYMTSYHTDGSEFADELKAEGITFKAEKHPRDKGDYFLIRT